MYVHQLSEQEQQTIKEQVSALFFYEEGLTGLELEEAIENAMDSKVSDLEEIIEL